MSYRHHKKWIKKYRTPKRLNPKYRSPSDVSEDANLKLIWFEYLDNGHVNVHNSPANLVWTFNPETGELSCKDLLGTTVVYTFSYRDSDGHVMKQG